MSRKDAPTEATVTQEGTTAPEAAEDATTPSIPAPPLPHPTPFPFASWLTILLGVLSVFILWYDVRLLGWLRAEPLLVVGTFASVGLYLLVTANAMNRANARHELDRLKLVRNNRTLFLEPKAARAPTIVTLAFIPSWCFLGVFLGGLGWIRYGTIPALGPFKSAEFVFDLALTSSIVIASVMCLVHRERGRKFQFERHASQRSRRLTIEAMEKMPVLVSTCTPEGHRSRFNARYLELTGRDEDELEDAGWLDCVLEQDRGAFEELFAENQDPESSLEIEYGMTGSAGENRWIREYFAPQRDADGVFMGYIATGVDITAQVENETEQAQQIDSLSERLEDARERREQLEGDVSDLKRDLTKAKTACERHKTKAESLSDTAKEANEKVRAAKSDLAEARGHLKDVEAERSQLKTEARSLERASAKFQGQVEKLEAENTRLREKLERRQQQLDRAKENSSESRRKESELRTKVNRLTKRCQSLQGDLDGAQAAELDAREEATEQQGLVSAAAAHHNKELASSLLPQIRGLLETADRLRETSLSDNQLSQLENAQATAAAIATLLDGTIGGDSKRKASKRKPEVRPFDLRAATSGVMQLLAAPSGVGAERLTYKVNPDFPPQVCGDPLMMREALMFLTTAVLRLDEDSDWCVRLDPRGATSSHVAARFEITNSSLRIDQADLTDRLGVHASPEELRESAEPDRYQASIAWQLISRLDGDFGLESNDDEGTTIWFEVTLPRRATVDRQRPLKSRRVASAKEAMESRPPEPEREVVPDPEAAETVAQISPGFPVNRPDNPRGGMPRLPQELLTSNHGDVTELGADSVRVKSHRHLSGRVSLTISSADEKIKVSADVESCERVSGRNHDTILRFVEMPTDLRQQILQLALAHRRHTMLPINSIGTD